MTNDLRRRVYEHKARIIRGFTYKYNIDRLVWFEAHDTAEGAITKEKQMKRWHRAWKIELIQKTNPDWQDISEEL